MNDLRKRSLTGVLFAIGMMAGTLIHPLVFAFIFTALLILTQFEFYKLIGRAGYTPQKLTGIIPAGLLFGSCFLTAYGIIPQYSCLLFIPAIIVLFLFEIFRNNTLTLQNSAVTLLGIVYVAVPFCLINFIVFPDFPATSTFYPWILAGVFFIVWTNDSMAYLAGSKFGKHKLAPKISPKKSWEGFIAGAVFAVITGILNAVLFKAISMFSWVVIALIVVTFGTFGDLFESKIKRSLNVKDSGTILPGHGGFLDRFDSLLFAIPVIYIWLIFN